MIATATISKDNNYFIISNDNHDLIAIADREHLIRVGPHNGSGGDEFNPVRRNIEFSQDFGHYIMYAGEPRKVKAVIYHGSDYGFYIGESKEIDNI